MKYKSELIKEIVETRGHNLSSPHYESECVKSWIEETKEAYPKLCDYESEWLNYIIEKPIGNVHYETVIVNPTATINNVVPYEYKSAILKGNTDENLQSVKMPVLTTSNEDGTKTNILTTPEDLELRGIGDVKDELNLSTGEVIERIMKISDLGDYEMPSYTTHDATDLPNANVYKVSFNPPVKFVDIPYGATSKLSLMCDGLKVRGDENGVNSSRGSYVSVRQGQIFLHLIKSDMGLPTDVKLTKSHLQEFFKNNPMTIVAQKAESTVKTVALTPLNKPYKGTNHYHLTANIPCEAILEVPVVSTGKQTIEEINN